MSTQKTSIKRDRAKNLKISWQRFDSSRRDLGQSSCCWMHDCGNLVARDNSEKAQTNPNEAECHTGFDDKRESALSGEFKFLLVCGCPCNAS